MKYLNLMQDKQILHILGFNISLIGKPCCPTITETLSSIFSCIGNENLMDTINT